MKKEETFMKDFVNFTGDGGAQDAFLEEAKKVAASYDGKSENDLLKSIYARAVEGKRSGTLTNEQIDAFYAQFSPMLDGAKRKKLQKIVAELKKM